MRALLLATLCAAPLASPAQDAAAGAAGDDPPGAQLTEMDAVRVIGRRPPADPFAFRNPVEVEDTVFSRAWDEPPSLEEIGMRGGYVQLAIDKGLELTAKGIRRLPGWKNPIGHAVARPPPLDEAQQARAARLHDAGDAGDAPP